MAIIRPEEHIGRNPRIDGFKLLSKVQKKLGKGYANFQPVRIIPDDLFPYYLQNKKLGKADIEILKAETEKLFNLAKSKRLVVRRAYNIPGIENPPGPRFIGLKSFEEVINAVYEIYDFAISNKFHIRKGSRIEIFIYPFTDPPPVKPPLTQNTHLTKGGNSNYLGNSIVRIQSVFGNNEGVQSLTGHDQYLVDAKNLIIREKYIADKKYGLFTTRNKQDEKLKIPVERRYEQVLNDLEILQIAITTYECSKIAKKPQRSEFTIDEVGLFFNELLDFKEENENSIKDRINYIGEIVLIESEQDIIKVTRSKSRKVLFISRKIVEKRNFQLLNKIAAIKKPQYILYPGYAATAHAMRVLVDAGHYAFTIGRRDFIPGSKVQIEVTEKDYEVKIQNIEFPQIINLYDAIQFDNELIGGKAMNLSRLANLGYSIPKGYVIKSDAGENFIKTLEFTKFQKYLQANFANQKFSVRSSANIEDSSDNSMAGQFESYLNIKLDELSEAVTKVKRSADNGKFVLNTDQEIKMAVIIQEMIEPKFSGVIFGANLETKNRGQIIIEITKGYASDVVDNKRQVRQIVLDKINGRIIKESGIKFTGVNKYFKSLYEMYMSIEESFDNIQDIEWTIGDMENLYLLQTRDLKL